MTDHKDLQDPSRGQNMVHLFAYGTLRPSLYPTKATAFDLIPLGKSFIKGNFEMIALGGFPGLIEEEHLPFREITGELVRVPNLLRADGYEGFKWGREDSLNFYTRRQIDIIPEGKDEAIKGWVYLYNWKNNRGVHDPTNPAGAKSLIIESGDWEDAIKLKNRITDEVWD